jgi:hypothetical protein
MNPIELNRSLVQLRLSGMAAVLETRLLQAQSEAMAPIDLISILVSDELTCRSKRLLERRHKQAQFRDPHNHRMVGSWTGPAWVGTGSKATLSIVIEQSDNAVVLRLLGYPPGIEHKTQRQLNHNEASRSRVVIA